jgi:hypothetical protein
MFMQGGDKDILVNVGRTLMVLVALMVFLIIAANILV